MALLDITKGSFTSGELSPKMFARQDVDRYRNGAALLENWQVLTQGGVTRRPGLRHVALTKLAGSLSILRAFEPNTDDAYILEIGNAYIRFYIDSARLESPPGTPVEVVTPYLAADLRLLRTAQSNDVMLLVHGGYAPQRLSRLSATSFNLQAVTFDPPPTYEAGYQPASNITLSALTGTITVTAATAGTFLDGDLQRQLTSGVGRGVITAVTSGTQVTVSVRDAFTDTTIDAGDWTLTGSPVAVASPSLTGPVGAMVTVTLGGIQPAATELLTNGNFGTGDLTGYSNFSAPTLSTGTHDGAIDSAALVDSTADFLADGVLVTQTVLNTTDGSQGQIAAVSGTSVTVADPGLIGGTEDDFDTTDAYTIQATGSASVSGGAALLGGGTAGVGWIEQGITTVAGQSYRWTFTVADSPLSFQVGSGTQESDLAPEATFPLGEGAIVFEATSAGSYLQARNNQPTVGKTGNWSCKIYSLNGFRSDDVGKYLVLNGGLVRITAVVNNYTITGEIVKELTSTDDAAAGAWALESPAWSDDLGWPSAVVFYEGRLYLSGSATFPQTIWGSAVDDFFNFALGSTARDAVRLSLVDSGGNITLNRLRWLMPAENLLTGTTHGEYRLIGAGDDPISASTPPRNRIQSTFGSDTVQPLKVGEAVLFAQRQGSKLREIAFEATTNTRFVSRDITITSEHLLRTAKILELSYQQEPVSTVYGVRSDGVLLGLTYDLSEQIAAWYRLVTQGTIESCATIPFPDRNAHQAWVSVLRDGVRSIEYFDPYATMALPTPVTVANGLTGETETWTSWQGLTVDAGVVYSGAATTTLTGLAHLNGVACVVVGDGAVLPGTYTPSGGSVTLPRAVASAFIGRPFTARGRALPVDLPTQTLQGLRKRWVEVRIRMENTLALTVESEPVFIRVPSNPMDQGNAPFTGDASVKPLGWDRHGVIVFESNQPLPATILGFQAVLNADVGSR